MEHKEAMEIIVKMLGKKKLSALETEALLTAIGVLSWTTLAKSRMKKLEHKEKLL